ncbi:protein yippee-like At5g53940 isoform X2 [Amborella trichopoda]|uniref:Protein yippee-like n=1 Tax=Amborella trichopoda TaxID=13333 RepID=W1NEC1_AMBTC|nr:protein yippee-like At5g53940 isoform X2 [Amborella trichopoda]XP_011628974.1 protein yippee-like At5g53940 isoform X2 [Amborella trichopoda]ERM93741.1 hypothetical protein AMTR_s00004p00261790 [Amborella trichopoda]|eukprot:XP_006826504.1 protein yippee-like At5g53940 isoform X2 [Amborella trichopoda]
MGRVYVLELDGKVYRCRYCKSHLALAKDLASKDFHCRQGKAYLFHNVVNVNIGDLEERLMTSGMHTVADIFCSCCGQIVGWKYEAAHEKTQKYKEGKFILERGRIVNGIDSEFYLDTHLGGSSDAEDA